MIRSTLTMILGLAPLGLALTLPEVAPIYAQTTTPQTVQVERGGADIYTQPEGNALVIGTYQAGVILTPRLRVFNPEGQAWLKIGDHWIPEESVLVLEGDAKPATSATTQPPATTRPTPVTIQKPSGTTPATPATPATTPTTPVPVPSAAAKPPAAKPTPAPAKPAPKPQPKPQAASNKAVLVTKEAKAQINVRTAANTTSDVIHAGKAGDAVQILTRQTGEGGFTWYKVKFPTAKVQGWVRGDFIKLGAK
ncbi:MAG: SH3 domain-containing protein [Thermosynechococcaceae cyanobacterium]